MFLQKKLNNRFFSVIFLLILLGILLYLTFKLEDKNILIIRKIEVKGSDYLSNENYFKFAKFDNYDDYKYLNPRIIRDRISKHPYVANADVFYENNNKIIVLITEKNFIAQYFTVDNKNFLITDNFEIVPILPETKKIDLPILEGSLYEKEYKPLKYLNKNDNTFVGLKILSILQYENEELHNSINEINLNFGKTIILDFNNFNFKVFLNKDNIIKKVVGFNEIYKKMNENIKSGTIDYIDMRFNNLAYIMPNIQTETDNGGVNE